MKVPGRICLVGEHCDWAGGASVVVPMNQGIEVTVAPSATLSATAVLEGQHLQWQAGEEPGALRFVPAVAAEAAARWGHPVTGSVVIGGDLPAGRGFSSSAALCVGLVRVFAEQYGHELSPEAAAEIAYQAERVRVGVACGRLDQLACAFGVPLYLRWGSDGPAQVLPLSGGVRLVVGSFSAPRDTPGILACLQENRRALVVRRALRGFGFAADIVKTALPQGNLEAIGASMNRCQQLYEAMEVAFPPLAAPGLRKAVRALRLAGARGAKFSGAGGDGSVIGLYGPDDDLSPGLSALRALGLDAREMSYQPKPAV